MPNPWGLALSIRWDRSLGKVYEDERSYTANTVIISHRSTAVLITAGLHSILAALKVLGTWLG
ncbi:hypothetical protein DFH09DRAFT_1337053 [Mycena vulgaris]|nr:hypothetical protein DFH09DRAFT_1337053 [Mycena vulgaris]